MPPIATRVTFQRRLRTFEPGSSFELRPLTILVGDNGTGKSTLLQALFWTPDLVRQTQIEDGNVVRMVHLRGQAGTTRTLFYDFEKENPRTNHPFTTDSQEAPHMASQWTAQSHGETIRASQQFLRKALLNDPRQQNVPGCAFLLDEPDTALSPRACYQLAQTFRVLVEQGHQVIAAVHNPIIMLKAREVLSIEHRRWMDAGTFLRLQENEMMPSSGGYPVPPPPPSPPKQEGPLDALEAPPPPPGSGPGEGYR